MKYPFRLLLILVFLQVLLFSYPVYSEDQSVEKGSIPKIDLAGYSSVNSIFLEFYRHQADILHNHFHKLFSKSGLNEFLLKQMVITSEVQDGHYPSALPSHAAYRNHLERLIIEPVSAHEPTLYERMSEHLQSRILAPYKYKRATNTLLSVIVPIPVTDDLTIIPVVSYTYSLSDTKNKGLLADKEIPVLYGGINLSFSF